MLIVRPRRTRPVWMGLIGCSLLAGVAPPAAAADPLLRQYIEELRPEITPTDRFGTPVGSSVRTWRPMCGSTQGLTAAQYEALLALDRQLEEQADPERSATGTGLNITFNNSGSLPADAANALEIAAAYIENKFGDNLTMTINVGWQNMGGGVLGATGSSESNLAYASVRDSLIDDMDVNDTLQSFLPVGSTLPVRYNESSSTVTNESQVSVTWGNLKALGGGAPSTIANMTFNSAFNWDFDPGNGISSGAHDFQSVVVHEIGHAMGFVSDVDDDCNGFGHDVSTMDMFRFRNTDGCCDYDPDSLAEFTTTPRLVDCNAPNDAHTTDLISVEYRMSDGSPSQASHFRFSVAAIMDPALAAGESFFPDFFREPDVEVLDAIGWDFPVEQDFIELPLFDHFPAELDQQTWSGIDGASTSTRGNNEPTPTLSLNLNGNGAGGDEARTAFIDTSGVDDLVLNFYYQRGGIDDPPEPGDQMFVEYLNSAEDWVELVSFDGTGASETEYTFFSMNMPAAASHSDFRLRLRMTSEENLDDDWFVDDLCLGSAAFCADPFECQTAADCDDGVACTVESCVDGLCDSAVDDGLCDDGVGCTSDACDLQAGGCVNTPNSTLCDDGLACTVDICAGSGGCEFTPSHPLCDDGDPCTEDICDVLDGCQNLPNETCGGLALVLEDGSAACDEPDVGICTLLVEMPSASDRLLSVGFADVTTDAPGGFHQIPAVMGGADTAPSELFLELFPALVCDSYVTIGLQFVPTGVTDSTAIDPDFDTGLFNCSEGCGAVVGGWFNSDPPNGQGDAGNYPDNRVIIAQFAVQAGSSVEGMVVVFINDGMTEIPLSFECVTASGCAPDLNGDGTVDAADLAQLLGAWGPNAGNPADLNGDGSVDAADLAQLLGSWGPCA